jgi:large subunit ribosomal protein L32
MAVPRNRMSNARKNSRRAHHAKKPKNTATCKNCGQQHMTHAACFHCGFYKGRPLTDAPSAS